MIQAFAATRSRICHATKDGRIVGLCKTAFLGLLININADLWDPNTKVISTLRRCWALWSSEQYGKENWWCKLLLMQGRFYLSARSDYFGVSKVNLHIQCRQASNAWDNCIIIGNFIGMLESRGTGTFLPHLMLPPDRQLWVPHVWSDLRGNLSGEFWWCLCESWTVVDSVFRLSRWLISKLSCCKKEIMKL